MQGVSQKLTPFRFSMSEKRIIGKPALFMTQDQGSGAIIAPRAAILSALVSFAAVKALLIPLGLLNGPHQFSLFFLSRLDVVSLGDFPDLIEFHDAVPSISVMVSLCTVLLITHIGWNSRGDLKKKQTGSP
jgi:hypothetical protein